ncbi:hypothetical protein EVAR_52300_1 [Eumeta japonica]|uniref:Uncharacterized protein n=1 Tax=Eumeta variegata TaxID=151549 RepID=A0A4C1Y227_EUMVA|nr:hypothetical protein EVAR_52300_1 [Eumeta japonica]
MLVLDEGGEHSSSQTRSRPPVVERWWTPTGSRRHASVTRVGVDQTERACRPLIRLSTRRTAAARAVRVSEPRPSTSSLSLCPLSWCRSGAYAGPPVGARHRACARWRVGAPVVRRQHASVGVDLTERACRPLIRLSASDGSSQGSTCQQAASFNLFFDLRSSILQSSIFCLQSSIRCLRRRHPQARVMRMRSANTGLR